MSIAQTLDNLKNSLRASERMPAVFIGHGSPMLAIEDNPFTKNWAALGENLPTPQAILVISAHWMSKGRVLVDVSPTPKIIHDFYGFPLELYEKQYPAKGAPALATEVAHMLQGQNAHTSTEWGLDHGAWCVLDSLYPNADVPVFQISIDLARNFDWHMELGRKLADLRDRGVLLLGSGNIVHNLRAIRRDNKPYDWAIEFDDIFARRLADRNLESLTKPQKLSDAYTPANPTPDHYIPALSIIGAASDQDAIHFITEGIDLGSVSMRSFVFSGS